MRRMFVLAIMAIMLLMIVVAPATALTLAFDNSGGGVWVEYMHFPITTVPSECAQYKIVINGSIWKIYNVSGGLKALGTNNNFWSLVNSTGADIRIFNQSSQLYFWIEKWNYTNQTAIIWVNLTAGSKELNIAYGNLNATKSAYEDKDATLVFFDDFNGTDINTNKWNIVAGSVDNGNYQVTDSYILIHHSPFEIEHTFTAGYYIIEFRYKYSRLTYFGNYQVVKGVNGTIYFANYILNSNRMNLYDDNGQVYDVGNNYNNVWAVLKIVKTPSKTYLYRNGVLLGSVINTDKITSIMFGSAENYDCSNQYIDWVMVYKFADPANFGMPTVIHLQKKKFGTKTVYINVTYLNTGTTSTYNPTAYCVLEDKPKINVTSGISVSGVNATYGANISIKLINFVTLDKVVYNGTDVNLTYQGTITNSTTGYTYNVYSFTTHENGTLEIYGHVSNKAYETVYKLDGATVDIFNTTAVVGEPLEIVLPHKGKIIIDRQEFVNVTSITVSTKHFRTGVHALTIIIYDPENFTVGLRSGIFKVVWGKINLSLLNVDGKPVHYNYGIYNLNYGCFVQNTSTLLAGKNKIIVYYMGLPLVTHTFYLNHTNNGLLNITLIINSTNISSVCYNLSIVSPGKFSVINLSKIAPYGRFVVNHTKEVIITFENNSPITVTVTGSRYMYTAPYLYLYGSGNATITSYYALKADAESALGIPMNVTVNINGMRRSVYGYTRFVLPVDSYRISFPKDVLGFVLNDTNLTNTTVNLTTSLQIPKAVYKVPTHIVLSAYKVNTSYFKFPFIPLPFPLSTSSSSNSVQACIQGTLYNWYGSPVPNANVTVNITSLKTGFTITKVVNTGSTGTFSLNFSVVPGVNYSISAEYNGSSVYVNSSTKIVVAGGALPPAPSEATHTNDVVLAVVLTATLLSIGGAAYLIHKKRVAKLVSRAERKGKYFRRIK